MVEKSRMATSKLIAKAEELRYRFYCDLSGLSVYTSKPIRADTEEMLFQVWQAEGSKQFNQCHKCGRWVCDAMFNADVLQCVACAPWEKDDLGDQRIHNMEELGFGPSTMKRIKKCAACGKASPANNEYCVECGSQLPDTTVYEFYQSLHKVCEQ